MSQTGNTLLWWTVNLLCKLQKRFTVHRQQIRNPETRMIKVSEHLDLCATNKLPKYYVVQIYQCDDQFTEEMRINKENMFI